MDKGAHFHKCDFQVHSPRDLNWTGDGAVTEDERIEYAQEFVAACRLKALDAVAITDHHDLCFFKYIRRAAEIETDEQGNSLPMERRLTVFPGMELTLGVPCQALVIFDADFPVNFLSQAVLALGVTPHWHRLGELLKKLLPQRQQNVTTKTGRPPIPAHEIALGS